MKTISLILFSILAVSVSSFSTACWSFSCRSSIDYCYEPSCGFMNYSLNTDYFTFYFRDTITNVHLDRSDFEVDLDFMLHDDLEHLHDMEHELDFPRYNFRRSLVEMRERLTTLREERLRRREELLRKREEALERIRESREVLRNRWLSWNEAYDDWRNNVDDLGFVLRRYKRDYLRELFLYPDDCGPLCSRNYVFLYSAWRNVIGRLESVWNDDFLAFDCDERVYRLRNYFDDYCLDYPVEVRIGLGRYYDYLVAPKVCDW